MEYPDKDKSLITGVVTNTVANRESFGHKLYIAAWGIEILAAIAGLSVAIVMALTSYASNEHSGMTDIEALSEVILGSIPFVMVAIVELLKIPIVYLIYTSQSFQQKVFFSLILIGLTFITFETVAGGFERQYSAITKKVSAPLEQVRNNDEQIATLKQQNKELKSTSETTISNKYRQLISNAREQHITIVKDIDQQIVMILSGPEADRLKLKQDKLDSVVEQRDNEIRILNSNAKQSSDNVQNELAAINERISTKQATITNNSKLINEIIDSNTRQAGINATNASATIRERISTKQATITNNSKLINEIIDSNTRQAGINAKNSAADIRDRIKLKQKRMEQNYIIIKDGGIWCFGPCAAAKLENDKLSKEIEKLEGELNNSQFGNNAGIDFCDTRCNSLKKENDKLSKEVEKLESELNNYRFGNNAGIDFCDTRCNSLKKENDKLSKEVEKLESELNNYRFDIKTEIDKIMLKYQPIIDSLTVEIDSINEVILNQNTENLLVENLKREQEDARDVFNEKVNDYNDDERKEKEKLKHNKSYIEENEEKIRQYVSNNETIEGSLNKLASGTQLYRFAKYWKQAFTPKEKCIEYVPVEKDNPSPVSSFFTELFSFSDELDCAKYEKNERVLIQDVTEDDVTKVAFVWYGSLAFLVAIMGVVVAYGAFALRYPRKKHYMRENYKWNFTKTLRRWFAARLKKARKVRPTKEIPVEVIKEVPVDKVSFKEIPVEVVKKEVVHTPIYTNDPDLLKFGTTKIKDVLKSKKNNKKDE